MALAAAPDVPGFQALSPLGYGPTSTIYSAQSTTLGRWVALTVYSAILPDERSQKRFRRAFDVARRLGIHPAAVTMLDCGTTGDRHAFVATEIYERGTLEGRSQGGRPMPVDEVLRIGVALAGALETAHRADVIHGGVHPGRVLLGSDGEPALSDLGLVPLVERGGVAALTGPVSTCYHASPEVLEDEPVTPASDVFSLASTLYTALAGRPPYQRDADDDTPASLLLRILQHDVPPLGRADVPPSLEDALRRALSCSPRDRPGRALAFARELQASQQGLGQRASEPVLMDVTASLGLAVADAGDDLAAPPAPPAPMPAPAPMSTSASVFPDVAPAPPLPAPAPVPAPAPPPPVPAAVPPAPEPAPLPQVAPAPSSNGASPVQRVFIPYPAPEPPDPLHRDEAAAAGAPDAAATPGDVVQLFADDRPVPPAPAAEAPAPARPEPSVGFPSFQPDGPPAPPDLGGTLSPLPAPPADGRSAAWPEHPGAGASDPSEHRADRDWMHIPVGDENDPAAGAPPWPGPPVGSQNGNGSTAGDVEPDGFVWPDDSKAPGREATPEGLAVQEGPKRNGNGLSAGIGAGWPDTPRRADAPPADPNAWPYVADRPARGTQTEAPVLPFTEPRERRNGHDRSAPAEPAPAAEPFGSGGWAATPAADDHDDVAHGNDRDRGHDHDAGSGSRPAAAADDGASTLPGDGMARALPVIAVGVIVAVLTLGVAWVVMFGEDPGESANRSTTSAPPPDELRGDTGGEDVMAVENPTGVQLDWGATTGPQVVVIMSNTQPPRTLPAKTGSALLVPATSLSPDDGYCFAVVPATDPLPTPAEIAANLPDDALQPEACVRGATAETVHRQ